MDTNNDLYATLQVDPRAEKEVIEAAYRRLAAKYHPDVNPAPEAVERMKRINAAYDVISDPEKRRLYDQRRPFFRPPWSSPDPGSTWESGQVPRPTAPQIGPDALINVGMTVLLLLISMGGSRFGPRVLVLVVVAFLILWGIMALRRRR